MGQEIQKLQEHQLEVLHRHGSAKPSDIEGLSSLQPSTQISLPSRSWVLFLPLQLIDAAQLFAKRPDRGLLKSLHRYVQLNVHHTAENRRGIERIKYLFLVLKGYFS